MRFRSSAFYALVAVPAAILGLASGPSAALANDGASCAGVAGITASSTATIDVPIGSGSATPPTFTVTCDGAPVSGADVDISLSSGAGVQFAVAEYGLSGDLGGVQANADGVVDAPILTSGTSPGTFALTATWDGATATVVGQITGILSGNSPPPNNPAYNETEGAAVENCQAGDATCEDVAHLNGYRQDENLGPAELPSNWTSLTIPEQVFTLTDLERTARGLPPDTGLAADMDQISQSGANAGDDPDGSSSITPLYQASPLVNYSVDPADPYTSFGGASIWYGGDDAIAGDIGWVYTDGLNQDGSASFNLDCTPSDTSGCWGHRDNILHTNPYIACDLHCAIGAATAPSSYANGTYSGGDTEFWPVGGGNNSDPLVFSWAQEAAELPACEQNGDTCSWSGQPTMGTAIPSSGPSNGLGNSGSATGGSDTRDSSTGGSSGPLAKKLAVVVSRVTVRRGGRIVFTVRFTKGSGRLSVVAKHGHTIRTLRTITKVGGGVYKVTATLLRGTWTLTGKITPASGYAAIKPFILKVRVG